MNLMPESANENRVGLEQILIFLNYKENPNLADFFGTTLLHFAVTNNYDNFEIVEKLIKAGANVNAQNYYKQTPLHLAALRLNGKIIDSLLAHDADINIKESKGDTALHFAIGQFRSGQKKQDARSCIVKTLLHRGADPNISNSMGETPLMLAVRNCNLDLVKDLLAFGANVNFRNQHSETCLHLLCLCPQPDIAILKELLIHGAYVNCYNGVGQTALDILLQPDRVCYGRLVAKSLIKIATLVNWGIKMVFQTSEDRRKLSSFEKFMDRCYKEVYRMKSYIYSDQSNLCHFAIYAGNVANEGNSSRKNIFNEVLDTLTIDCFPIYEEFIEAHFDETFLKEKLLEVNIYARNIKGKICLHSYAVLGITTYLSRRELLNLFRAYSKPSYSSLVTKSTSLLNC